MKRSKYKPVLFVLPDDEIHNRIAIIANTVEQYNRLMSFHFTKLTLLVDTGDVEPTAASASTSKITIEA